MPVSIFIRNRCATKSTRSTPGFYDRVNNGVYQAGFASTQAAYDQAVDRLFAALDELERRLSHQPLSGGRTAHRGGLATVSPPWCVSTWLIMGSSSATYVGSSIILAFGSTRAACIRCRGVAETVRFDHIKRLYYSLPTLNPNGIIPKGPDLEDRFGQP